MPVVLKNVVLENYVSFVSLRFLRWFQVKVEKDALITFDFE
jgi:hypothetical protein